LEEVAHEHASFVRQLASKRALVKRVFYIIIPADFMPLIKNQAEARLNAQTQLRLRSDELLRQLVRMGLTGQRLDDREIVALYQSCYLQEEAKRWPISAAQIEGTNRFLRRKSDQASRSSGERTGKGSAMANRRRTSGTVNPASSSVAALFFLLLPADAGEPGMGHH
jgi:hypothetical protein